MTPPDAALADYVLPAASLARATALYHARILLTVADLVYGVALLIAVLAWRIAPRLRDLAERLSPRRPMQALVFAPLLLLVLDVLALPLGARSHALQLRYGLSVQGWGPWWWDWAKGELVGIPLGTLVVAGLYALLRRFPGRWWLVGWLASVPLVLLLTLAWPVLVNPLFDHFEPLAARQPQLVHPLQQVMARGGLRIEPERMFEMRASDKVTTYNAYVTGIGATKRVVVWDNTARDLTVPETMFVFAHEQGHYALHHVWIGLALEMAGLLLALYAASRVAGATLRRFGARWHVRGLDDWASLPALLLLSSLFALVAQPVRAGLSRAIEHQADVYGLEAIHGLVGDSPQVAAHAFQKLGEKSLAYPMPNGLFVWFTYDHPPIGERLRFATTYRPWDSGEPARYVR